MGALKDSIKPMWASLSFSDQVRKHWMGHGMATSWQLLCGRVAAGGGGRKTRIFF